MCSFAAPKAALRGVRSELKPPAERTGRAQLAKVPAPLVIPPDPTPTLAAIVVLFYRTKGRCPSGAAYLRLPTLDLLDPIPTLAARSKHGSPPFGALHPAIFICINKHITSKTCHVKI